MLRYSIKLNANDAEKDKLELSEKYLDPNLSYITGVTSVDNHLDKHPYLTAQNSIINSESMVIVDAHDVIRQGFIVIKGKKIYTHSGVTYDYSSNKEGDKLEYRYIINNDKYFYWGEIPSESPTEHKSGYTINNLLNYDGTKQESITEEINIECGKDEEFITADTVVWIEEGKVIVDGHEYIYERHVGEKGGLKYLEDGEILKPSAITECNDIEFYPSDSMKDYSSMTKVKFTKNDVVPFNFDKLTFAKYYFYVHYKNNYCNISQISGSSEIKFVCSIPKYLVSGSSTDYSDYEFEDYAVYYVEEYGEEGPRAHYDEAVEANQVLSGSVDSIHALGIYDLNDLRNLDMFVKVEGKANTYLTVEKDIINANGGTMMCVYLESDFAPLNIGDVLTFKNESELNHQAKVYNASVYSGKEDDVYVYFNGKKYKVLPNVKDKALINEYEYDIIYNNGKKKDKDCLVMVGDEMVPMKITDDAEDGGEVQRYGAVLDSGGTVVYEEKYKVKPYSGISVYGKIYIIDEDYAAIDLPQEYRVKVEAIKGSSMYVCRPEANDTDFTDEFNRMICEEICQELIDNQTLYSCYIKNKIFGDVPISESLPFIKTRVPISSDDYYNLFEDLDIFLMNKYINIPIQFTNDTASDLIKDDTIKRDFYKREREKAINEIVDMEKDIYLPKYIRNNGDYVGSDTDFLPISRININLHFRSRDLGSWKVNEGYNLSDTSGCCDNWFITDFQPYADILKNKQSASGDVLHNSSDLMGLLYFTNDDVFYQREKISRSFLRLSFYDSIDPQNQTLLGTSCVYFNEHDMFKKYIDNSRKYVNDYGLVVETPNDAPKYVKRNRISVMSEYLALVKKKVKYDSSEHTIIDMDESHRISSRLVIDNKYNSTTSSEGFYIYIFREYSEDLHPKPIYMKAEFNHAGIGKTIPMLIPMRWMAEPNTNINNRIPQTAYTLSNQSDLTEMKKGIPLSYLYAQTYVPFYAVYDFKNKEYAYVIDNRYLTTTASNELYNNGVLNLNLFEMKIMDEPLDTSISGVKVEGQAIINIDAKFTRR